MTTSEVLAGLAKIGHHITRQRLHQIAEKRGVVATKLRNGRLQWPANAVALLTPRPNGRPRNDPSPTRS